MCIPSADSQNPRPLLRYGHLLEALIQLGQPVLSHGAAPYQHKEITMIQETMTQDTTTHPEIRPSRYNRRRLIRYASARRRRA